MIEIPQEVLYDKRLLERHIAKGMVTREQVEEHLKAIQDAGELGDRLDLNYLLDGNAPKDAPKRAPSRPASTDESSPAAPTDVPQPLAVP